MRIFEFAILRKITSHRGRYVYLQIFLQKFAYFEVCEFFLKIQMFFHNRQNMNTIYENLESQLCPYSSYFMCLITKISRILKIFQYKLFAQILKNKVRHDSTNICKLIYKGVSKDLQVCKVNATSQVGCQLTFAKNLCKITKILYFCNKTLYPPI